MTPAQADLLKRCIAADRAYRSAVARKEPMVSNDWRGVEIHRELGVDPRTAAALDAYGLIEIVNLHGNRGFCFLGKYEAVDLED